MSTNNTIALPQNYSMNALVGFAEQQFRAQGYEVNSAVISNQSATITVKKNRDGFSNIIGLGVECRITLTAISENAMSVSVESEWTNKIIAIAVGWFLCLIPFITGIVGCVNQSNLSSASMSTIQSAAAGSAQPQ